MSLLVMDNFWSWCNWIKRLWFFVIIFGTSIFSCKTDYSHVKDPTIVNHPTVYSIDKLGRIVLTAKCNKGEQMVGGGYTIPTFNQILTHLRPESEKSSQEIFDGTNTWSDKATPCDKNQFPLSLEASYPSERDTWTVILYNPDVDVNCYHFGDFVQVDCYCVTNQSLPLNMHIYSVPAHPTNLPDAKPMETDKCNCPEGSVVTAGGFKLEPEGGGMLTPGYSPLWGSYPNIRSDNKVVGWCSDYLTIQPSSHATLTTYVLCSAPLQTLVFNNFGDNSTPSPGTVLPSPLKEGPVKQADAEVINGFDNRVGSVECDEGYFSPGGGFRLSYAGEDDYYDIPHGTPTFNNAYPYVNGNRLPFGGWTFKSFAGHNSPGIKVANGTVIMDRPTSEKYLVYAIQIGNLPLNLEVAITNPPDGTFIKEDQNNKGHSEEIIFKGYANDHDGSSITGNNLEWNISGNVVGNGEQFKSSIDLSSGNYNSYMSAEQFIVRLTATSKDGDKATATILIYYMSPIL